MKKIIVSAALIFAFSGCGKDQALPNYRGTTSEDQLSASHITYCSKYVVENTTPFYLSFNFGAYENGEQFSDCSGNNIESGDFVEKSYSGDGTQNCAVVLGSVTMSFTAGSGTATVVSSSGSSFTMDHCSTQ